MKPIEHLLAGIVFATTLLASGSAFALTPFDVATSASRGQLDEIDGHQSRQVQLRPGQVTGEDILEAAGVSVNAVDADLVEDFLKPGNDD